MHNHSAKKMHQGFTLIELMIVVAIIGVLAAIGLPAYQDYVVKGQAASALAEITPAKAAFEIAINEGRTPSTTATAEGFIGVTETGGSFCTVTVTASAIACATRGGNATHFNARTITLTRSATDGTWTCTTSLAAKYRPGRCTAAAST